jgi:hypothetical protein
LLRRFQLKCKNDHLTKTGSGQLNIGKALTKLVESGGLQAARHWQRHLLATERPPVRKTPFWSNLYIKTIILPRQARDKHRENSKKDAVSGHRTPAGEQKSTDGSQFQKCTREKA